MNRVRKRFMRLRVVVNLSGGGDKDVPQIAALEPA